MMLTIVLPLTQAQAQSVVVAADALGVEPWEMAMHVLNVRQFIRGERTIAAIPRRPK